MLRFTFRGTFLTASVLCMTLIMSRSSFGAPRIAVIMSYHSDAHAMALKSFRRTMEDFRDITINEYYLAGSADVMELVRTVRESVPDLVLAVGTTAVLAAKSEFKHVPVVFCMALNPVSSGLVRSMSVPGGNITGASLDIPVKLQFQYIKLVVPQVKSIGIMYNPEETGKIVQEAAIVAASMDLSLIAKPVLSERDVSGALRDLLSETDVLWSVADGTVFHPQSTRHILLSTLRAGTPFMGLSRPFVKAGALMALSCDYASVGEQAAEIADRILGGANPGVIPVSIPREVSFCINLKTAKRIGLHIPENALKLADEIVK